MMHFFEGGDSLTCFPLQSTSSFFFLVVVVKESSGNKYAVSIHCLIAMQLALRNSNLEFGGMVYLHRMWQVFSICHEFSFNYSHNIYIITGSLEWLINVSTAYYIKMRNDIKTKLWHKCHVKCFEKYLSSTAIISCAEICHTPHLTHWSEPRYFMD